MAVLVNQEAPDFTATAVTGGGTLEEVTLSSYRGKYVLLWFYPLDFTFVCPTELHAFQAKLDEFKKLNVEVIGVSVDSQFSHMAWLNTPKGKGGIEGVTYTLVADLKKEIARAYDVLLEDAGVAFRGLFLIDKEGVVQHQVVNNLPLGRSVDEALRMVTALQHFETHGEVCPADWHDGDTAMRPDKDGLEDYFGD